MYLHAYVSTSLVMTAFHLEWKMKHNMVQPAKFIFLDNIVISLKTFITIYLQLNLSLPTYLQAFVESNQA